jgi:hypothetical protein
MANTKLCGFSCPILGVKVRGLEFAGISVYVHYVVPHFRYWGRTQKHRTENFFLVTTLQNPSEAILLATERWQIEETFDVMKNEFNIKHDFIYKGDVKAFRRLFTIIMIAMNLILYYVAYMEQITGKHINMCKFVRRLRNGFLQYTAIMSFLVGDKKQRKKIKRSAQQINLSLLKLFG